MERPKKPLEPHKDKDQEKEENKDKEETHTAPAVAVAVTSYEELEDRMIAPSSGAMLLGKILLCPSL
jgi:hypothetical protein